MRLIKCYIENFGVIQNQTFDFSNDINVFLKDNGSGKTTLAVFIKAMFYGLAQTQKQNLDDNERLKYRPWQGGKYGGNLTFSVNDKVYRIERFFFDKASEDTFKLYDNSTNRESKDYSKNIGRELFELDSESYEKSIYIPQKDISLKMNDSLRSKLTNLVEQSNGVVNCDKAISDLDSSRKTYLKQGNKGLLPECKSKISETKVQIEECRKVLPIISEKNDQLNNARKSLTSIEQQLVLIKKNIDIASTQEIELNNLEQLRKLEADYHNLSNQYQTLEKFFEKYLPSKSDITSMIEVNDDFEKLTNQIESLKATSADEKLAKLSNVNEDNLEEISNKVEELKAIENKVLVLKNSYPNDTFFNGDVPSIEQVKKEFSESCPKNTHNLKSIILLSLLSIITIALIVSGIVLINNLLVLGIILLVLGVTTLIATLIMIFKMLKKPQVMNSSSNLKAFLKTYYGELKESNDYYLHDLIFRIEQYQSSQATLSNLTKEMNQLENKMSDIKTYLNEHLKGFITNDNYYQGLDSLKATIQEKRFLEDARKQIDDNINNLEASLKIASDKLRSFLEKFPLSKSTFREMLRIVQNNLEQYTILQATLNSKNSEIEEFKKSKKIASDKKTDFKDLNTLRLEEKNALNDLTATSNLIVSLEMEIKQLQAKYEEIENYIEQLEELCQLEKEYTHKVTIYNLTIQFLKESRESLSSKYLSSMEECFNSYLSQVINELDKTHISVDLNVMVEQFGESKSLAYFSEGYKDIINFCLRLALVDCLYTNELPFLILDDPFTNLDSQKLQLVNNILKTISKKYQIIYLICHPSRDVK